MKKQKDKFTIDDLDYSADKVKQLPDDITQDYYNRNVNAYLTRNDSRKSYYISPGVTEMLIDLQKRIDAQNIQTLQPMQPKLNDEFSSGIATVILDAMRKGKIR
jgi:hypothetical protein